MLVVTAKEMRELDRLTIEKYKVPSLTLMERAGEGVFMALLERFPKAVKKGVLVVVGRGNTGGDGLVIARYLKKKGFLARLSFWIRKTTFLGIQLRTSGLISRSRARSAQ